MGDAKKLNLNFDEVCDIARSLNQNILANRSRKKEDRIQTDHYIREKFSISRKDFSLTARDYGVKYNSTSCLYDIPEAVNQINTKVNTIKSNNGSEKVNQAQALKTKEVNNDDTKSIPITNKDIEQGIPGSEKSLPVNLYQLSEQFNKILSNEILSLTDDIKEMLEWYKEHKDKKIAGDAEINLNNEKLNGEVVTRSYKVYKTVAEEFSQLAADRKESIKDLISLALMEFVDKYKK
jgi:hypothetical protein